MLLSDSDIKREIASGRVVIEPYSEELVQPASIDVRLSADFVELDTTEINPAVESPQVSHRRVSEIGDSLALRSGAFILGSTVERITLPNDIAARVEGKSSLGRLGLLTHVTAGFIDPGFSGQVTLELCNLARAVWVLHPGMLIGQICFFRMSSPAERPYGSPGLGSHYQGQIGATPSAAHRSFTRWNPWQKKWM